MSFSNTALSIVVFDLWYKMPDNDWKCYPSQLPLLFSAVSFSVLYLEWPTVSVCLGLSWFQQRKFQVSRKPLSSRLVYPDVPERPVRNNGGKTFHPSLSTAVSARDFPAFSLKSAQDDVLNSLGSQHTSSSSTPPHLSGQISQDLLILLSGWSKPPIILFCSIKDICFPRHMCVHTKRVRIMS